MAPRVEREGETAPALYSTCWEPMLFLAFPGFCASMVSVLMPV
ncbi:MAG TPA: hypothetical protein PKL57_11375 [Candidatus Wallbacteria bacterium]|nr:hypothetical protein [Candidatus Wallbacteria bacterium]